MYLNLSKCEFGKTSLIYLSYIVGVGHLKIDPTKIEVIVKLPRPQNVTEVRSFLGAVRYWRKFISQFSLIASPLHALTGYKVSFQWGGKQKKSFDTVKKKIVTTPILALSDLQQRFKIETCASGYAMGKETIIHIDH